MIFQHKAQTERFKKYIDGRNRDANPDLIIFVTKKSISFKSYFYKTSLMGWKDFNF